MATLSSLGTGSGLDLQGILTKLMTVEQQPLTTLTNKTTVLQSKLSAFGTLKGTLSALQLTAQSLSSSATFNPVSASLTDSSVLAASASSGAVPGSYAISVGQLAQAQVLRSNTNYAATTATFNTGSLAISVGGATATNITIDSSNNTLSGIRDAINTAKAGLTASIVNDGTTNRLLLASSTTGLTAGAISVSVTDSGNGGANALSDLSSASLVQTQAPLDANFSINGLAISRSANTVTDAIDNVSFTLNKAGTLASPITTQLNVSKDAASVRSAVTNFVSAYNSAIKQIKSLSSYDAANDQPSVLTGDATLRTMSGQLSNAILGTVSGLTGGLSTLADIGVTLQKDGSLATNTTKLLAVINDTTKDLPGLFNSTATGKTGIAVTLNSILNSMVGTSGSIASRTDGINRSIKDISKQQEALNLRLTKIEANYRAQFTALDATVASMQGTSTYLTQQLDYLKSIATGVSSSSSSK
jgi:flagellar hook-associated protein 2